MTIPTLYLIFTFLFYNLYAQILQSRHYQQGVDRSLFFKDLIGPGTLKSFVKFDTPFKNIPQVMVGYGYLHFTYKQNPNYNTTIENITIDGFTVIYTTSSDKVKLLAELNWFAFDSEDFGEVQYIEMADTGELAKIDIEEHSVEMMKIKFTKKWATTPHILISIIGCQHDGVVFGPRYIVNLNYTQVTNQDFDLVAQGWYHAQVKYIKIAILAFRKDMCTYQQMKEYQWEELGHDSHYHNHNWVVPEMGFQRFQNYEQSFTNLGKHVMHFTSLTGYDGREVDLRVQLKDVEIDTTKSIYKVTAGTWDNSKLAGAFWNFMICRAEIKSNNQQKSFYRYIIQAAIGIAAIYFIYKLYMRNRKFTGEDNTLNYDENNRIIDKAKED